MLTSLNDLKASLHPDSYSDHPDTCHQYGSDRSSVAPGCPDAVVFPKDISEIQTVLRFANIHTVPVVTRGAGTGTSGGAVPHTGGIVLSLEKWTQIETIDPVNRLAVVSAGVVTSDLQRAVQAHSLFYPPDPASLDTCTIGGNIATNAGGPRCLKYGVTGDYVLALEAVLPTGECLQFGCSSLKDVAGYDVKRLLIGSEGTLGIVTKATLRLVPYPTHWMGLVASFRSLDSALETLNRAIHGVAFPCAVEFMDRNCLVAVARYLGDDPPADTTQFQIVFVLDGFDAQQIGRQRDQLRQLCDQNGASDLVPLASLTDIESVLDRRRQMSPALRVWGADKVSFDVAVPIGAIAEYMKQLPALSDRFNTTILGYGHLGDGNIHVNILRQALSDSDWAAVAKDAGLAVCELAVSLGGTISGEHGIGMTKASMMDIQFSPDHMAVFRRIKSVFDPNHILNPGKLSL